MTRQWYAFGARTNPRGNDGTRPGHTESSAPLQMAHGFAGIRRRFGGSLPTDAAGGRHNENSMDRTQSVSNGRWSHRLRRQSQPAGEVAGPVPSVREVHTPGIISEANRSRDRDLRWRLFAAAPNGGRRGLRRYTGRSKREVGSRGHRGAPAQGNRFSARCARNYDDAYSALVSAIPGLSEESLYRSGASRSKCCGNDA